MLEFTSREGAVMESAQLAAIDDRVDWRSEEGVRQTFFALTVMLALETNMFNIDVV